MVSGNFWISTSPTIVVMGCGAGMVGAVSWDALEFPVVEVMFVVG